MKLKTKPIFIVRKPTMIKVYRGKFRPFESTKYLDVKALRAKEKVTIECGTLEFGDLEQTVAVEIRKGMIVALKPIACAGCSPRKSKRTGRSLSKDVVRRVLQQLADRGLAAPSVPVPIRISRTTGITIDIGDITIWIVWGDICVLWWNGNKLCWWCLVLRNGCLTV